MGKIMISLPAGETCQITYNLQACSVTEKWSILKKCQYKNGWYFVLFWHVTMLCSLSLVCCVTLNAYRKYRYEQLLNKACWCFEVQGKRTSTAKANETVLSFAGIQVYKQKHWTDGNFGLIMGLIQIEGLQFILRGTWLSLLNFMANHLIIFVE